MKKSDLIFKEIKEIKNILKEYDNVMGFYLELLTDLNKRIKQIGELNE